MRYKSIELINYGGIYNGMGLSQIKIDFDKCISNKIVIRGDNGSGKSTLESAINLMPDPNDKFIPNLEARKNLVITDNGIDYIIRYIHPVNGSGARATTRGYISKFINGEMVELNPNGNISSCREIIFDEFNFDSGYISLSQLSSEDRGLVDRKPIERKKLVNNISASLETYNNIYKALSKKSSSLKTLMNSISGKIDMIGDEPKLLAQINSTASRITTLEQDRNEALEASAAVKVKISEMTEYLNEHKYSEIVTELSQVNRLVKASWDLIEKFLRSNYLDRAEDIKPYAQTVIDKQIIKIEYDIETQRSKVPMILAQRETEYRDLLDKQEKLNAMQSDYNYSEIKAYLDTAKQSIDEYESTFARFGLTHADLITKDEFDSAMEALKYLKDSVDALFVSYSDACIARDIMQRLNVQSMISSIPSLKVEIEQLKSKISVLHDDIILYASKQDLIKELTNRPAGCTIDDCPYIASAVSASKLYPEDKFNEMNASLSIMQNDLVEKELLLADCITASECRLAIGNIERELKSKIKFIMKLPVRSDFESTFLDRIINHDPFNDIEALYPYIDCGNMLVEYKVIKEQYNTYLTEFNLYQSKNAIIESMIADIESLQYKVDALMEEVDSTNATIKELQESLEHYRSLRAKYDSIILEYESKYLPNFERKAELEKIKTSLDMYAAEVNVLRERHTTLINNLGGINSDIRNLTEQKERLNHSLAMLAEYKTEMAEYVKNYNLIEKIRYYASPNTGIQSVFINIYMNKILKTANELLGLLFGGEFVLQPFVVNESEFRIPCLGDGLMHDDISSMSTAQKSMISMIISFALLQQSSTRYNVICCDELDGGLDTNNRAGFVNLLDTLMRILNCEQAFIISHNNELDTSMLDIISLKNNSGEPINGNIIWKL